MNSFGQTAQLVLASAAGVYLSIDIVRVEQSKGGLIRGQGHVWSSCKQQRNQGQESVKDVISFDHDVLLVVEVLFFIFQALEFRKKQRLLSIERIIAF